MNQSKIGVTTLGTVNGVTFQYYKKGNIITISSYGILDTNIGGWSYINVPSLLPVKLRPQIEVNATWSTASRPFRMSVKPDGKVSIQNSNDGPGGIGLNIPLSVSYAVDW